MLFVHKHFYRMLYKMIYRDILTSKNRYICSSPSPSLPSLSPLPSPLQSTTCCRSSSPPLLSLLQPLPPRLTSPLLPSLALLLGPTVWEGVRKRQREREMVVNICDSKYINVFYLYFICISCGLISLWAVNWSPSPCLCQVHEFCLHPLARVYIWLFWGK